MDEILHGYVDKSLNYLSDKADDVLVEVSEGTRYQIRFTKNEVIIAKRWNNNNLGIFLAKDKKVAVTNIDDLLSWEKVNKSLEDLLTFANALSPNQDFHKIATGPFNYSKIPDLYDSKFKNFVDSATDKVEAGINQAIENGGKESAGILEWEIGEVFYKSSNDVTVKYPYSNFEYLIRSFASPKESGQGLSVGRMLNTLDTEQAGLIAGSLAKQSIGAKTSKSGKYQALLSPTVVADIIASSVTAANPFSIESGTSWLKDKVGEKVGSDLFTAYDDGTVPNGYASCIADEEGSPTQKTRIFDQGVFKNVIHNTNSAIKYDTQSTGNAGMVGPSNHNIVIEPGTHSFDELVAECKEPTVYVTSNWYTRTTSQIEGIFSTIPRDCMLLIENGEIKQPVRELRISDTFPNLVKNITAVQNKVRQIKWWVEVTTPTFAPAMIIKDVNFSTGTQ